MVMAREIGKRRNRKVRERTKKDSNTSNSTSEGIKKRRGRKTNKPSTNAARERSRVQNLKQAFLELQKALPNVPQGTKLSKLDILLLASNYISHLMSKLSNGHLEEHLKRLKDKGALHPIKKWPMRSRLYVSDPMWLYRSQGLVNNREVKCENKEQCKQDDSDDVLSPRSPTESQGCNSSDTDFNSWQSEDNDVLEDVDALSVKYDDMTETDVVPKCDNSDDVALREDYICAVDEAESLTKKEEDILEKDYP